MLPKKDRKRGVCTNEKNITNSVDGGTISFGMDCGRSVHGRTSCFALAGMLTASLSGVFYLTLDKFFCCISR